MSIHRRPSTSSSYQQSHAAQPPSPGSASFRSANVTLPETTSFYQQSIEASRTSLSDRRFHAVNSLHREKSTSRLSHSSAATPLPVDDEIAQGLGEEVNQASSEAEQAGDTSSTYNGFLPARDKSRQHSILPSAAFFSPKRPPQSYSPHSALTSLPPTTLPRNAQLNPSSDNLNTEAHFRRGEPIPLDASGKEARGTLRGRAGSLDAASSFALGSSSSSDGHGRNATASASPFPMINQTAVDAYRHAGVRSQASRDPLLATEGDGNAGSRRESSYWTQSATKGPTSTGNAAAPKMAPSSSTSAGGKKGKVRRYKTHRGSNKFFLCGLIMTSDDNPFPFLASLVVMVALPILWFIFVAPYVWHHISPAPVIIFAYVWAVAFSSMCVTAWRDPGVLPRDLDPDPPCTAGEDGKTISMEDPLAVPLPRIVRVRNGTDLKVKWCDTCGTYRPPRSSHCRVCDNCVENIDHHCTFLNTCIGRRNYFSFFAFLIASIISCFMAIAFCILHIYYLTRAVGDALPGGGYGEGKSFGEALSATPLSAVIFLLAIGVVGPLLTLFGYHVRLVCMNRTTVEQIRINTTKTYSEKPSWDDEAAAGGASASAPSRRSCLKVGIPGRDPNPFAHRTIFRNVKTALLRPMAAHSWIDRYHYQQHDTRRINPAFAANE